MEDTTSIQEKLNTLGTLIEEMHLAHAIHDNIHFKKAHHEASALVFHLELEITPLLNYLGEF